MYSRAANSLKYLMTTVLIVEDESAIHKLITAALSNTDYSLVHAYTAQEGISHAAHYNPDIILLDIGLPEQSGFVVLQRVREWSQVPIIILSARSDENNKITALDAGADDYVVKPFSIAELLARMRAVIRARNISKDTLSSKIESAPFSLDIAAHILLKNNQELHLTPTEFKLFSLLFRNAGKVLSHRQILKEVWGPGFGSDLQYLREFMKLLRQKIEDIPSQPIFILTEPGIGYRFKSSEKTD